MIMPLDSGLPRCSSRGNPGATPDSPSHHVPPAVFKGFTSELETAIASQQQTRGRSLLSFTDVSVGC